MLSLFTGQRAYFDNQDTGKASNYHSLPIQVTTSGTSGTGHNRTKIQGDDHVTDLTFEGSNDNSRKFDGQMFQPHSFEDDLFSISSADLSQTSKKPMNGYYH